MNIRENKIKKEDFPIPFSVSNWLGLNNILFAIKYIHKDIYKDLAVSMMLIL